MPADAPLLDRLETYYDAVPRPLAEVEEIGPFTLFVAHSGWSYYARPRLGDSGRATVADVRRVLDRQRVLGVARALEWVHETTPALAPVVERAGMTVAYCPLLVLDEALLGTPGTARMLGPDDVDDLARSDAAIGVAFDVGGTDPGAIGLAERDAAYAAAEPYDPAAVRELAAGRLRAAAAYVAGQPELGPVGGGRHRPVGGTSEITGVGVLPAFRGRGLASAVTHVLAADARAGGATLVFCSAEDDDVARIYARIGFRRVGTACIAEGPFTAQG